MVSKVGTDVVSPQTSSSGFFKLPRELQDKIIDLLVNEELVEFALTCRASHNSLQTALEEHRQLLREWTYLSNLDEPAGYLASRVARHFVDARLLTYTHYVEIDFCERRPSFNATGATVNHHVLEALRQDVRQAVRPEDWPLWEMYVNQGRIDGILWMWAFILEEVRGLTLYLDEILSGLVLEALDPASVDWCGGFTIFRASTYSSLRSYHALPLTSFWMSAPSLNRSRS